MKFWKNTNDEMLDRTTAEIREQPIERAAVDAARDRVWARVAEELEGTADSSAPSGAIRECAGFRALMPAYLSKSLPNARVLLLDDHVKECVVCRRALQAARMGEDPMATRPRVVSISQARKPRMALRIGFAAAAAVMLAVAGLAVYREMTPSAGAGTAEVGSVEGALYRVAGGASLSVASGQHIAPGDGIRTAKDSRAVVRLADGSTIEMKERSEISLAARNSETTIHLARGSIIVQAAKQRGGHLYVAADDCLVSVVGTIFSVNRGSMGSRVSVIEGEVHVEQGRSQKVLRPGQQVSTAPSLTAVPVSEEISWSRDSDRYKRLLDELTALGHEIDNTIQQPGLRHATRLLDSLPETTVFYAAIPNLTTSLADAHRLIRERIDESELLKEWWTQKMGPSGADPQIEQMFEHVRTIGAQLGDEIVLAVQAAPGGDIQGVLMTAELKDPAGFRPALEQMVRDVGAKAGGDLPVRIVDDSEVAAIASTGTSAQHLLIWAHGDRLVAASSPALLRTEAAILAGGGASAFVGSAFHARLADSYREGAGWLVGVDVRNIVSRAMASERDTASAAKRQQMFERMGVLDAQYFIFESKSGPGESSDRATLTFDQSRRGLASWLAAPAPMGALDYVTSDASIAGAVVVKNPAALLDDFYGLLGSTDPAFAEKLSRFESDNGISIRDDLAAPLGGEAAFALDGPVLPVPSWKFVLEVYDAIRLQRTIELMVGKANATLPSDGKIALEHEEAGGTTWYSVRCPQSTQEVHYVYASGYLIAAPSRALLERALQARDAGQLLTASAKFRALLPQDGEANASALLYQDIGSVVAPFARQLAPSTQNLTDEEKTALGAYAANVRAQLVLAYGEPDRIVFASKGGTSFGSNFGALLGMQGLADMRRSVLGAAKKQAAAHPNAGDL